MKLCWNYASKPSIYQEGLNDHSGEVFKEKGLYSSLAREFIQNSSDVRVEEESIKICFDIIEKESSEIPGIESLRNKFEKCKTGNIDSKTKKKIDACLDLLKEGSKIKILKIVEHGTKGMNGVNNDTGYAIRDSDLHNFFYKKGTSDKDQKDGGSFGLGKNTYFTTSNIRTVIASTEYRNESEEDESCIIGLTTFMSAQVEEAEGSQNQTEYESHQWYLSFEVTKPFKKNDLMDNPEYNWLIRDEGTTGTTFFILGIPEINTVKEQIQIGIINNFFLSIIRGKLVVKIQDELIDESNIVKKIEELKNEANNFVDEDTMNQFFRSSAYIECDKNPTYEETLSVKWIGKCSVKLKICDAEEGQRKFGHTVIARNDFLVCRCYESKNVPNLKHWPSRCKQFVALIEPKDIKSATFIKNLENPSHSDLTPQILENEEEKSRGKEALDDLGTKVRAFIGDKIKEEDKNTDEINRDFLNEILPYETGVADFSGRQEKDRDPERSKVETKPARKTKEIIVKPPISPVVQDPDSDILVPDPDGTEKIKWPRLHPGPGPRPIDPVEVPASSIKGIEIDNFKFIRISDNRAKLSFSTSTKGAIWLILKTAGLDSTDEIRIVNIDSKKGQILDENVFVEVQNNKIQEVEVDVDLDSFDLENSALILYGMQPTSIELNKSLSK